MSSGDDEAVRIFLEEIGEAEEKGDYSEFNQKSIDNRLGWYERNKDSLELVGSDVRKGYELIMIKFMGLTPDEVKVVYEDEGKIVWWSTNWCPVLEACKKGGFDTKKVCRLGEEESVQRLIENINPNLRYTRNYDKIRPYTDYCEEIIYLEET